MSKFWVVIVLLILFVSCQVKENPISDELLFLKNDTLSIKQLDSILKRNEIHESDWYIHKTDSNRIVHHMH